MTSLHASNKEFVSRRKTLMAEMQENSIAILAAATEKVATGIHTTPFGKIATFYLSGFNEPNAVLVLVPGREEGETLLFCQNATKNVNYGMDTVLALKEPVATTAPIKHSLLTISITYYPAY